MIKYLLEEGAIMVIAILGFGTVGKGVYDIIMDKLPDIKIKYILDRHPEKTKATVSIKTLDYKKIVNDPQVDVIVEVLGGKENAYPYVIEALKHKKHVVTANKALVSACFKELHDLAASNHVSLRYEASVGGGIIVLDPLKKLAKIDDIDKIEGIINGSTNYILSKIFLEDYTLEKALVEAGALGYIETGTTDDLDGLDLMRKINILSMIAYKKDIKEEEIEVIPLSSLDETAFLAAKRKGQVIKYLAISEKIDNKISIKVEPKTFEKDSEYANINYEENIIKVYSKYNGIQTFKGLGAGRYPTASAIVYDLLSLSE